MYRLLIILFSVIVALYISPFLIDQMITLRNELFGKVIFISRSILIFPIGLSTFILSIIFYNIVIEIIEKRANIFSIFAKVFIGIILIFTFTIIIFSF